MTATFSGVITFFEIFYYFQFVITILLLSIAINSGDKSHSDFAFNCIISSLSLYVLLCVIFFILGIKPSVVLSFYDESSRFGSYFGFSTRKLFPFTPGINSFATVVGISLIASIYRFFSSSNYNKLSCIVFLTASSFAAIATDSRGPMIFAFSSFWVAAFVKARAKYVLATICSFILVATGIYYSSNTSYIDLAELNSKLTNRPLIWLSALNEMTSFRLKQLVGYGMYGQTASGISDKYSYLFSGYESANLDRVSLHNVFLQVLFDNGYLGLILYLLAVTSVIVILRRCNCNSCNLKLIILCYLLLLGLTEPVPSIYNSTVFVIFLIICATPPHLHSFIAPDSCEHGNIHKLKHHILSTIFPNKVSKA